MIIKKLILHKYKRFFLTGIETLTYQPEKTMQIIVSKNGAGKSSLLQELNPLPADIKRNYYEGGYKYIEILHYGKLYKISSGMNKSQRHSMILDDVELNPGGTKKVQLDLVKEHFNITSNIMDILLNHTRLTTMSPLDRKKWLSEISTIDYEYPIKIYNRIKSQHRDILGAMKLAQDELIKLSNSKLNQEQLSLLLEQRDKLVEFHRHILPLYHLKKDVSKENDLIDIRINVNRLEENINYCKPERTLAVVNTELTSLLTKKEVIETEIKTTTKTIDDLEKLNIDMDPEQIKENIKSLTDNLNEVMKSCYLDLHPEHIVTYYNVYRDSLIELKPLINELSEYDQYRLIPKQEQDELLAKIEQCDISIKSLRNTITHLDNQLARLEKGEDIELPIRCPVCSAHFPYKIIEHKKTHIEEEKAILKRDLDVLIKEGNKYLELKKGILQKNTIIQNMREVVREAAIIKPIWTEVFSQFDIHIATTETMVRKLDKMLLDLEDWSKATEIYKEKQMLENKYQAYQEVSASKTSIHKDKFQSYVDKLDKLTKEKNELISSIKKVEDEIDMLKIVEKDILVIKDYLEHYKQSNREELRERRNTLLSGLMDYIQYIVLDMDKNIREYDINLLRIKEQETRLALYKKQDRLLNYMVKSLSPTEGLIAKSINSFLQVFVKEMNSIINKIWSYDLELLPCEIGENNDLDYKFRVRVNNDEVIEDVSRLSTGMKEIVDLAFRIVFIKYKKLSETPLYLDEFGHGFDKNHRTIAYNVIDKILSSDYPQVFIVCHYESLYGSFKNVDFNVLDNNPDNATGMVYNNRLKLTY